MNAASRRPTGLWVRTRRQAWGHRLRTDLRIGLYTGAISVQQEGKTALTVYSKDVNGNVEDKRVVYVKIDKTAPTVRCSLRRTFSAKATLRLTARDALSGVRSLSWSWDGHAAKKTSKASILVSTARAGVHTLRFWSRDRAGHVSAKHSIRVIVR